MEPLVGKGHDELVALMADRGHPAYRARQLADWIYQKRAASFEAMTDLPQSLRRSLADEFTIRSSVPETGKTSGDGATKHLIRLDDSAAIECVGLGGFGRNLSAGEMVEQWLWMQDLHPNRRISHGVFMGMGEPLLNTSNVVQAVRILRSEVQVSARNLTISTVGIVPGMIELASAHMPVGLAVSLHAPDDAERSELIPTTRRWPIADILSAARRYRAETGRDVTYEYILLAGVNDTMDHARRLADLLSTERGAVNLIPYNPVAGLSRFAAPSSERIAAFRAELQRTGLVVTERGRRGRGVVGACGQLAGDTVGRRRTRTAGLARNA